MALLGLLTLSGRKGSFLKFAASAQMPLDYRLPLFMVHTGLTF